jgi:hypothetical protein
MYELVPQIRLLVLKSIVKYVLGTLHTSTFFTLRPRRRLVWSFRAEPEKMDMKKELKWVFNAAQFDEASQFAKRMQLKFPTTTAVCRQYYYRA